ncbi:MAG: DUF452 family protein [Bacteroides sp.]|nr:DUF452 family protein [Bacteroides sp.]
MKFHIFPSATTADSHRAILLFAGWGMDFRPFADVSLPGYRLIAVWDYRDPTFPPELMRELEEYDEIAVIAWSFGVPAATRFLQNYPQLPVTARIAVNGTMHPMDDSLGIPTDIFNGTLDNLSEKTLSKFHLRMCGSSSAYREFSTSLPQRNVEDLRDELRAISTIPPTVVPQLWDCGVVSLSDRIIPPANQTRAWESEACEVVTIDGPHLPDFNHLLRIMLTAKGRVADKFARAETTYDTNATVQHDIARHLLSLVPGTIATPSRNLTAIEIGCGTGWTSRLLAAGLPIGHLTCCDLHIPASFPRSFPGVETVMTSECDAETELRKVASESLDLIFSASTMQWFNSPSSFLRECGRTLRRGGVAMLSTFGPDTMRELTDSLPYRRHYPSAETIGKMLPTDCELIHLSTEVRILHFPSPADALRHIKLTGVNALPSSGNPSTVRRIIRDYPLTPAGEAPVTYQPIYLLFKKSI